MSMKKDFSEDENRIAALIKRKRNAEKSLRSWQFKWLRVLIMIGISIALIAAINFNKFQLAISSEVVILLCVKYSLLGGIIGFVVYSIYFGFVRLIKWNDLNEVKEILLRNDIIDEDDAEEKSKDDLKKGIDFFTNLVSINFKYIEKYYSQTQRQADKSFIFAVSAGIAGFLILCTGILMMYYTTKTASAYVTVASGVLGEFISSIFFFLYNRTILRMSQYHQKLVITQNISLALKTAEQLNDEVERTIILKIIIDRLTTDVNKHLTGFSDNEK